MAKHTKLAKEPDQLIHPPSSKDGLKIIAEQIIDAWNEEYQQSSKTEGKFSANIFPEIPSKLLLELKLETIKLINRLVTNHYFNKVLLPRIDASTSNGYNICDKIKTKDHPIFHCDKFLLLPRRHSPFKKQKCLAFNGMKHENIIKSATFFED